MPRHRLHGVIAFAAVSRELEARVEGRLTVDFNPSRLAAALAGVGLAIGSGESSPRRSSVAN